MYIQNNINKCLNKLTNLLPSKYLQILWINNKDISFQESHLQ